MNVDAVVERIEEVRSIMDDLTEELREVYEEMIALQSMLEDESNE